MNGYDVYCMYLALKSHFTTKNYDYHKYNGKCSASVSSFQKRRDKFFFERLSQEYPVADIENVLVSQFIEKEKFWIGEVDKPKYLSWRGKQSRLLYDFQEGMCHLVNIMQERDLQLSDIFNDKTGEHPIILREVLQGNITQETFIILNSFLEFYKILDDNISFPIIWDNYRLKCTKYENFIKYDRKKFKQYLIEKLKEIA